MGVGGGGGADGDGIGGRRGGGGGVEAGARGIVDDSGNSEVRGQS